MSLIKTDLQISKIRQSGKILGFVLRQLKEKAAVSVSLMELDELAHSLIIEAGAKPAFLGYHPDGARAPFPYTLCASINDTVVHGQPSAYRLKSGDVLKLDLGVDFQGGITDSAVTVPIGKVDKDLLRLIKATRLALEEAIRFVKPGHTVGDIGFAVERTAKAEGIKIMEGLTGHGVGNELHEEPVVYNFGRRGAGMVLKPGMVIAIEPMTSLTTTKCIQKKDDSFVTYDKSVSAHFEHTVLVTKNGKDVLTL
ncbi:MAG: type I methionyl aminopeptidase [Candidatus Colwellbacteria bacterium RIFCSPHIGHO2_12_FULL_43_12]|uniref:Methionine aminopeptidase n=2 Tax=Candidatus Colwelliibacteriota TaxID=1817904 RepID=A0A1G1Z4F9_9BACT|nr:MAG: type I methionyl aminopeptidase [Candidatus Colwellbacteria bacterium RIFCSPHIGHO2_12_FULL_43_12]OGY60722.1 MAG: type I methionyl aminopeptidase [Candidatus Colwellbacteria bacterium RIFCSPLOWO2_12_FULL_43_11]